MHRFPNTSSNSIVHICERVFVPVCRCPLGWQGYRCEKPAYSADSGDSSGSKRLSACLTSLSVPVVSEASNVSSVCRCCFCDHSSAAAALTGAAGGWRHLMV